MYQLDPGQVEEIRTAIEDAGGTLRTDYSGRAMYGARCVGFDVPAIAVAMQALVQVAESYPDPAKDMAGAWTQDADTDRWASRAPCAHAGRRCSPVVGDCLCECADCARRREDDPRRARRHGTRDDRLLPRLRS
jgi:hypothetical protein